jgi:hypothetical protein
MPRILDRLLAVDDLPAASVAQLLTMLGQGPLADSDTARACVSVLIDRVQLGELAGERGEELRQQLAPLMTDVFADPEHPLATEVALLGTTWRDGPAMAAVRQMFLSTGRPVEERARAFDALIAAEDAKVVEMALRVIREPAAHPFSLRESAVAGLAELDAPHVGASLIEVYPLLEPEFQPRVIEALTGRPIWSRQLLDAIAAAKVPANALNANHVRKLLDAGDAELAADLLKTSAFVTLHVAQDNIAAKRAYENAGFRKHSAFRLVLLRT